MAGNSEGGLLKLGGLRTASAQLVHGSQVFVVAAAQLLVVVAILVATGNLYVLFTSRLDDVLTSVRSLDALQAGVEQVFAGVLLLMLGLELLKSLTSFFTHFRIQIEIIVIVAMIGVTRHVMLIDLEDTPWTTLVGAAALVLALAVSYALVRRGRGEGDDDIPPAHQ